MYPWCVMHHPSCRCPHIQVRHLNCDQGLPLGCWRVVGGKHQLPGGVGWGGWLYCLVMSALHLYCYCNRRKGAPDSHAGVRTQSSVHSSCILAIPVTAIKQGGAGGFPSSGVLCCTVINVSWWLACHTCLT
jgi:hypothetical protein